MTDNIADTLKECHRIVWAYRQQLEDVWPTPTTEDALLFAFTELGEAIDAHLRSKDVYARNRDKDLSVLDELADCAMMLLTALGAHDCDLRTWMIEITHEWNDYTADLAYVLDHDAAEVHTAAWEVALAHPLFRVATHPGMDLPARLAARLERIKAKRMPRTPDSYDQILLRHAGSCQ